MLSRRGRELPLVLLTCAALAAATFLHGLAAYRRAEAHLDGLVRALGRTVAETAAAGLASSLGALAELERSLAASLRLRSEVLARSHSERDPDVRRFAAAAGLSHVLLFDAERAFVLAERDVPPPEGVRDLDPARLDLAIAEAVAPLVAEAEDGVVVRELALPGLGADPSLVAAAPLASGGFAVLVQDARAFARVREAASAEATAARLESATRVAYVRVGAPAPAAPPESVLALETALALPDGTRTTLRVGIDRSPANEALRLQLRSTVLAGSLLVAVATAAAYVLVRLARARAALLERVQREERLSGLGRLAASVAHEVRNPLNAIAIAAQRIRRDPAAPAEAVRLAGVVAGEVERLDRTVESVLRYARPRKPRVEAVEAAEVLRAVEALARPEAEAARVDLEVSVSDGLPLLGDRDLLQGALFNLVRNAVQASPAGAPVRVSAYRRGADVVFEVLDRGPGVPADARDAVFEPFRSTRPGGSGLGLPLALSAAQAHGGTIEVDDAPGGGARFRMVLPGGGR